jgi:ribosomal protein S18 acetylase RimI-like enzyme
VLSKAEVIDQLRANYMRSNRDIAEHCGGTWAEADGLAIKDTGLSVEGQNGAFVLHTLPRPRDQVAAAIQHFEGRGLPYGILVPEGVDMVAEQACRDLGLRHVRSHPGMALQPLPDAIPGAPAWLTIHRVTTAAEHDVEVATDAAGFESEPLMARKLFPASLFARPYSAEFVGYVEDVPVATAVLMTTGSTAGIYGVATIPSYRRRGIGTAMTWRAVAEGIARGCRMASLQASDDGQPVYERMGFRIVTAFEIYARQ